MKESRRRERMTRSIVFPTVGMIMAESAQAGLIIVSKVVMSTGMSSFLFVFYSNAFASVILFPSSLFVHRSAALPPITFPILCSFFLLGFVGSIVVISNCTAQFCGYGGIYYSSPTLGAAMLNLIPGFTFVLAVAFRMEILDWKSFSSLAKLGGTIISILGAFIITFYKGLPLLSRSSYQNASSTFLAQQSNWTLGGLLLVLDCCLGSSWIIIQALVLEKFPAGLIIISYYCLFVAIQSAFVCLAVERDLSAWSLAPSYRLFAVLYSGIFGSAFQLGVSTWCLRQTGPVFVSMFKPLGVVIAIVVQVIFLGDTFYLGSFIGAIVIVAGFYCVIWGKSKEEKEGDGIGTSGSTSSSLNQPLLHNNPQEL